MGGKRVFSETFSTLSLPLTTGRSSKNLYEKLENPQVLSVKREKPISTYVEFMILANLDEKIDIIHKSCIKFKSSYL